MYRQGELIDNRFKVQKVLGKGGQAVVYLCEDLSSQGRVMVVKELVFHYTNIDEKEKEISLFRQESCILAEITHPTLPGVSGTIENECGHFIIEDYIEGTPLDRLLRKSGGKLSEEQVLSIALQMASLLECLHTHNPPIIIRDIKPSNMIIRDDGKLFFIDFTIARHMVEGRNDTVRMGSPGYAPPEQYRGCSTPQSDIYAFGVTLHQLLTGHDPLSTPFTLPEACSVNEHINPRWETVICRATQLRVEDRFKSAAEVRTELEAIEEELKSGIPAAPKRKAAISAFPAKKGSSFSSFSLSHAAAALFLVLAAGALVFSGYYMKHRHGEYQKLALCMENMAAISGALELYTNDHGEFPEALDDLIPYYLPERPLCPKAGIPTYRLEVMQQDRGTITGSRTYIITCTGGCHKNVPEVKGSPFKTVQIEKPHRTKKPKGSDRQ